MKLSKLKVIVLILFLLTAGCHAENKTFHTEPSEPQNEAYRHTLPVLKVIAGSPGAIVLFQMEEKRIEEKYGVRLKYYYPNRLTDNLEAFLFATDETFDILVLFPVKIPLYAEKDLLLPLDTYTKKNHGLDDIIPVYRKLYMQYGEHDYGMVFDGDSHLLFYRKDLFEKYNQAYRQKFGQDLTPPNTWEAYDRIARFLTLDTDQDGNIDIYGTAILSNDGMRYIWFVERYLSMGGSYFDEDMHPLIDQEIGIQALQDLIDLLDSGVTPPNAMYDWVDLNNAFLQGKLAMVIQWSDTARFSYDQSTWYSKVRNKVDWALVPNGGGDYPRGGTWIGRVLSISKNSQYPDKAWQVIQHLTSKKVTLEAVNSYATINDPFRESHFAVDGKGPFPNERINQHFLNTLYASLKNTNTDLMIPGSWEYMQALDRNMGLAFIHKLSSEEALKKTALEWEAITEKYGRERQKKYYQEWLRKLEEVRQ